MESDAYHSLRRGLPAFDTLELQDLESLIFQKTKTTYKGMWSF